MNSKKVNLSSNRNSGHSCSRYRYTGDAVSSTSSSAIL